MQTKNKHFPRRNPLCVHEKVNIIGADVKTLHHSTKMSSRILKYLGHLRMLKKATSKMRKKIMKGCNRSLLCCLCECAQKVLKGNVPLSKPQKSKLSRFKDKLRRLASKKTRVVVKKKIVQIGGFLAALIPPVLSFLGMLLNPHRPNGVY